MDDHCLDSVVSVLSECMQYSGNEDLSDLDRILLSLGSSSSHVGDLLDEILVTRQRQVQDGVVAKLQQPRLCLSELCVQYESKLLFRISQSPIQRRSVVPYSGSGRPRRIVNFALVELLREMRYTWQQVADVYYSLLHQVILRTLGELSQFRDGLDTLGVARAMEQYGVLLQEFFVNKKSGVTADGIRKIFKTVRFSEEGSNAREKEQNSYMMFLDYLDECEKVNSKIDINEIKECEEDEELSAVGSSHGSCDVSLEMVMVFFSGADAIPPMGYPHEPLINFNPESPFPTASTCALQLTLPTCYTDYGPFKHALNTAFTMHGGFGMS